MPRECGGKWQGDTPPAREARPGTASKPPGPRRERGLDVVSLAAFRRTSPAGHSATDLRPPLRAWWHETAISRSSPSVMLTQMRDRNLVTPFSGREGVGSKVLPQRRLGAAHSSEDDHRSLGTKRHELDQGAWGWGGGTKKNGTGRRNVSRTARAGSQS